MPCALASNFHQVNSEEDILCPTKLMDYGMIFSVSSIFLQVQDVH